MNEKPGVSVSREEFERLQAVVLAQNLIMKAFSILYFANYPKQKALFDVALKTTIDNCKEVRGEFPEKIFSLAITFLEDERELWQQLDEESEQPDTV